MPKQTGRNKKSSRTKRPGLYAKVITEAEQMDFETAAGIDGIDDEITILRVKMKAILETDPGNIKLIFEAAKVLAKLVKSRYSMTKLEENSLEDSIGNVLKEYKIPLDKAISKKQS
jgi:hypothetical protein